MTTTDVDADADADAKHLHCGCCGRTMPADRLTELGSTPGVSICSGCALWAARRPSRLPDLRRVTRALADGIARIRPGRGRAGAVRSAIPLLPSSDLDRTILLADHP